MHNHKSYFTKQVLTEVMKHYSWSENYQLETSYSNSVLIKFPKCTILMIEGFDSDMNAYFLNKDTGRGSTQYSLSVLDAVGVIKGKCKLSKADMVLLDGAVRFLDIEPSVNKVKQGINNICILLQVYLKPCIDGDFSWVIEYNMQNPNN